jgi:hypothetical protein
MDMIINIVLLAVSAAAVFYCIMLNRRLVKLMDAEKGLGVAIASMSTALEETKGALQSAREDCRKSIEKLEPMLAQSSARYAELSELSEVVSEMCSLVMQDIEGAAAAAIERISAIPAAAPRQSTASPPPSPFRKSTRRDAADAVRAPDLTYLLG